jgi:hypothetical protein
MEDQDFWTTMLIGIAMALIVLNLLLRAQGIDGYFLLLIVGVLAIFVLGWLEHRLNGP